MRGRGPVGGPAFNPSSPPNHQASRGYGRQRREETSLGIRSRYAENLGGGFHGVYYIVVGHLWV